MNSNVLVDLDGVIRDYIFGLLKVYRNVYPNHEIKEITSRKLEDFFPIGDKIDDFIKKYQFEIIKNSLPYNEAIESLQFWSKKYDIIIVTSQEEWAVQYTTDWIKEHNLPVKDIIISFDKHLINGIALLDDFIVNLEMFRNSKRLAVCYDQPWNKGWTGPRVQNINEFFNLIES